MDLKHREPLQISLPAAGGDVRAEVGTPEEAELLPVVVCGVRAGSNALVKAVAAAVDREVVAAGEGPAQYVVFVLFLDRIGRPGLSSRRGCHMGLSECLAQPGGYPREGRIP